MKCKEIEKFISAYANNELDDKDNAIVKKHLESCPRCRESLEHFKESGRQLHSLRETPPLPDMKPSIISRILTRDVKTRSSKRIRLALAGTPVAIATVVLLILQLMGFFVNPTGILSRAYAATEKITTYHSSVITESTLSTSTVATRESEEANYDGPDRYHVKKIITTGPSSFQYEIINYDGEIYYKVESTSSSFDIQNIKNMFKQIIEGSKQRFSSLTTAQMSNTQKIFDYVTGVKQLPDEKIDGLTCLHYQASYNLEKVISEEKEYLKQNADTLAPQLKASYQLSIEALSDPRSQIQWEFWISKDDYLIRQIKQTVDIYQPVAGKTMETQGVQTISYTYNLPVIVEAPLTKDGQLLPGWHPYDDLLK